MQKDLQVPLTAAWFAQLGECQSAEWEVTGSNPGQTNTQGLKITEEKVLTLEWHLQMVRLSSLLRYGQKTLSLISQHFHLSGRWWTKKNPHHCSKRVGDVDLSGVANLSWAWWVNCEDTLKLEPHSVVCSAPYGGSDYEINKINNK